MMTDDREREETAATASERAEGEEIVVPDLPDDKDGTDTDNRRNGDTKVGLTLRIVVAAYVLYLAYGLIRDFGQTAGNNRILIAIAIVIFIVAGGAILFFSGKKLIRKEYIDADGNAGNEAPKEEHETDGGTGDKAR